MRVRINPAATGWRWVREGMGTFWRQPLAMSGLFFMFIAAASVLSLLPQIGTLISLALVPAATLGLMAATRVAREGRFPMPSVLLTAFRGGQPRLQAMLLLGGLYAVCVLLIIGAAGLFAGDAPPPPPLPEGGELTPEAMGAAMRVTPGTWLVMLLYLPVALSFWHAPPLVFWHGVKSLKSLFFSLVACWSNKGALLLYTLGWVGVIMFVMTTFITLGTLFGGGQALGVLFYPTLLFLASMYHTSLWFTFRDSFELDAPEAQPLPSPPDDGDRA